jgi:hypothetical protein
VLLDLVRALFELIGAEVARLLQLLAQLPEASVAWSTSVTLS